MGSDSWLYCRNATTVSPWWEGSQSKVTELRLLQERCNKIPKVIYFFLNSPSTALPDKVPTTSVQEIYQLNQYIKVWPLLKWVTPTILLDYLSWSLFPISVTQDAIQREQLIENKLAAINKLMASTKDAVDSNWKVLISEDRLLTRVDILERQLQASHKV